MRRHSCRLRHLPLLLLLGVAAISCRKDAGGDGGDRVAEGDTAAGGASRALAGKTVGFSQMESDNPWRIAETRSLRDEAARRGVQLVEIGRASCRERV